MNLFFSKHRKTECVRCIDLRREMQIRSPDELDDVLRMISDKLANGTLVEVTGPATRQDAIEPTAFAELLEAGARPDMIKCDFKCSACNEVFHLRCETYHGSGGRWSYGQIG